MSSSFRPLNKSSLPRKGSPTNRAVVPNAGRSVNRETTVHALAPVLHGKCMMPSVPIAALRLRSRSNPAVTVQFIAVTATPNEEIVIKAE
jgi:hypothetical protein